MNEMGVRHPFSVYEGFSWENKMIAKIASDFKKPYGLTVIKEDDVKEFLFPLKVRKIPGVGPIRNKINRKRHNLREGCGRCRANIPRIRWIIGGSA